MNSQILSPLTDIAAAAGRPDRPPGVSPPGIVRNERPDFGAALAAQTEQSVPARHVSAEVKNILNHIVEEEISTILTVPAAAQAALPGAVTATLPAESRAPGPAQRPLPAYPRAGPARPDVTGVPTHAARPVQSDTAAIAGTGVPPRGKELPAPPPSGRNSVAATHRHSDAGMPQNSPLPSDMAQAAARRPAALPPEEIAPTQAQIARHAVMQAPTAASGVLRVSVPPTVSPERSGAANRRTETAPADVPAVSRPDSASESISSRQVTAAFAAVSRAGPGVDPSAANATVHSAASAPAAAQSARELRTSDQGEKIKVGLQERIEPQMHSVEPRRTEAAGALNAVAPSLEVGTSASGSRPGAAAPTAFLDPQAAQSQLTQQIGTRLVSMSVDQQSVARLQLQPAELGALEIRITMHDDGAVVSISAQQNGTKDLIEAGLPRLREIFEDSGTKLLDVDVSDSHGGAQREQREADETAVPRAPEPVRAAEAQQHFSARSSQASARLLDLLA